MKVLQVPTVIVVLHLWWDGWGEDSQRKYMGEQVPAAHVVFERSHLGRDGLGKDRRVRERVCMCVYGGGGGVTDATRPYLDVYIWGRIGEDRMSRLCGHDVTDGRRKEWQKSRQTDRQA